MKRKNYKHDNIPCPIWHILYLNTAHWCKKYYKAWDKTRHATFLHLTSEMKMEIKINKKWNENYYIVIEFL